MNVKHIAIGWLKRFGWLPTSEAEAALCELRLSICERCPEHRVSKMLKFLGDDTADYVDTIVCNVCKCPCKEKALVVRERCPEKKW